MIARFANSPDDLANIATLVQLQASVVWRSLTVPGIVSIDCPQLNAQTVATVLSTMASVKYAHCSSGDTEPWAAPCPRLAGDPHQLPALSSANVLAYQWARKNYGQSIAGIIGTPGADMNLYRAWEKTKGNPQVVVAVVDISISIDHPALVNSLWTNPGEIANNDLDDDGDGIIDDVHGVKFCDPVSGDPRPLSDRQDEIWSHGTSAAGLIVSDASYGVAGIAPSCRLMSVGLLKCCSDENEFFTERCLKALDFVMYKGARISSWSMAIQELGPAFEELLDEAELRGHIVIASAGNHNCSIDTSPRYPAAYASSHASVIAVAATDSNDCLAMYSNSSYTCVPNSGSNIGLQRVLLGAPGWWNVSLRMMPRPERGLYAWFGGTSAAAPHVAGAVALLLSIHPEYSCEDVKQKLRNSGRPVSSLDGITISGKTLDIGTLINP